MKKYIRKNYNEVYATAEGISKMYIVLPKWTYRVRYYYWDSKNVKTWLHNISKYYYITKLTERLMPEDSSALKVESDNYEN
jgi:hypothetical protein